METEKHEEGTQPRPTSSSPVSHAPGGAMLPTLDAAASKPKVAAGVLSLTRLATFAFVFALQWAQEFFIPLILGILIAYSLNPVVSWLERTRLPRVVAVSTVMLALCGSSAWVATSVYNETQSIMDELPIAAYKLSSAFKRVNSGELSTLDKLRNAANTLKEAAAPSDENSVQDLEHTVTAPPAVVLKPTDFNLNDWLWAGSISAAAFVGPMKIGRASGR